MYVHFPVCPRPHPTFHVCPSVCPGCQSVYHWLVSLPSGGRNAKHKIPGDSGRFRICCLNSLPNYPYELLMINCFSQSFLFVRLKFSVTNFNGQLLQYSSLVDSLVLYWCQNDVYLSLWDNTLRHWARTNFVDSIFKYILMIKNALALNIPIHILYELNVNQFTLVQFNSGHLTTSQFSTGLSNAMHNYRPANFWKSKCLMVRLDTTTWRNLHRRAAFLRPVEKILLSMIQFGMEEQNDFSPKPRADSSCTQPMRDVFTK